MLLRKYINIVHPLDSTSAVWCHILHLMQSIHRSISTRVWVAVESDRWWWWCTEARNSCRLTHYIIGRMHRWTGLERRCEESFPINGTRDRQAVQILDLTFYFIFYNFCVWSIPRCVISHVTVNKKKKKKEKRVTIFDQVIYLI